MCDWIHPRPFSSKRKMSDKEFVMDELSWQIYLLQNFSCKQIASRFSSLFLESHSWGTVVEIGFKNCGHTTVSSF